MHTYFVWVAGFLFALTLWSFSDNLVWNVGQPSNSDPKFIVHGLFSLGWMAVLFTQAFLINPRSVSLHRQVGWLAAAMALVYVDLTKLHLLGSSL